MEILAENKQDFTIVSISGRLDAGTAQEMEKRCADLIDGGARKVILNLAGLEYVSSAGLRSVLATAKKLKATGGSLGLCSLSGLVQEVFTISGFDALLPIYDTVDSAIGK